MFKLREHKGSKCCCLNFPTAASDVAMDEYRSGISLFADVIDMFIVPAVVSMVKLRYLADDTVFSDLPSIVYSALIIFFRFSVTLRTSHLPD